MIAAVIYYEVKISAENQEQASTIMNSLLAKKLITGGQFVKASARFLWKGKVHDMAYVTMTSFTLEAHKIAIIDDVRRTSLEEVPMIWFVAIDDVNSELGEWIDRTLV